MLIQKKDRTAIYEHLFKEGVMVAPKDFSPRAKHADIGIANLYVIKALTSLKSRGYVKELYVWRHYYWTLTNEGIQYLREFLHLPQEIVPATLKRPQRQDTSRPKPRGYGEGDRAARQEMEDRDGYRRAQQEKEAGLPTSVGEPSWKGGFGQGSS